MAGRRRTGARVKGVRPPKSWVHPPKSPLQRGIPEGAALRPPESSAVGVCSKLSKRTWVRVPALSCGHALRRTAPWRHAAPPGLNAQEPACLLRKIGGSLACGTHGFAPCAKGKSKGSRTSLFAAQNRRFSRPWRARLRRVRQGQKQGLKNQPVCCAKAGVLSPAARTASPRAPRAKA